MNVLANYPPTEELQAIDSAHHLHPFSHGNELAARGPRVITSAKGVWLKDSDGHEIIDGMAGLWCVNIGYGRDELADAAARQMRELPYYNTFFKTTTVPALMLAKKLAELAPGDLNHVFFASGGSDANDNDSQLVNR